MNIFKQFWLSLYSPKDIAKFRFQGIGKTILYVFLLVLLTSLPIFIMNANNVINGVQSFKEALDNQIPDFEIVDGKLHSDSNEPIEISNDEFDIYFDATGTLTASDIALKSNNAFALLPEEIVVISYGTVQSQPLNLLEGFELTKSDISQFIEQTDSLVYIFISIILLISYIFTAGLKFIEISILALFALLIFNVGRKNLQYRHMWRISAYSVTLVTVFFAIMNAIQVPVVAGSLVNWGVSLVIIYLAYKEIPQPKQKKPKEITQ